MELNHGDIICCKTEKEARMLLTYLHQEGYQWFFGGNTLLDETHWNKYKEQTAYQIMFAPNQKYVQERNIDIKYVCNFPLYQCSELFSIDTKENEITYSDIALILKTGSFGLTKTETIQLLERLPDEEFFPLELNFDDYDISAIGFVTKSTAEKLEYDYEQSGLMDFIKLYLEMMDVADIMPNNISLKGVSIYIA